MRLAEFRFPQKTEQSIIIFSPALPVKKYFSRKECVRLKGGRASEAQSPRGKKGVSLFCHAKNSGSLNASAVLLRYGLFHAACPSFFGGRVVFSNIWVGSPQAQASGPMV